MKIEQTSANAITITYNGNKFLFMGADEDFDASFIKEQFLDILDAHHQDLLGI